MWAGLEEKTPSSTNSRRLRWTASPAGFDYIRARFGAGANTPGPRSTTFGHRSTKRRKGIRHDTPLTLARSRGNGGCRRDGGKRGATGHRRVAHHLGGPTACNQARDLGMAGGTPLAQVIHRDAVRAKLGTRKTSSRAPRHGEAEARSGRSACAEGHTRAEKSTHTHPRETMHCKEDDTEVDTAHEEAAVGCGRWAPRTRL